MPRQFGQVDGSAKWPPCPNCRYKHEPRSACPTPGIWQGRRVPIGPAGVFWIKRRMPDGQWPVDQRLPRDDSFSWWVRSTCGHQVKQWAFYEERYADMYEQMFRDAPCWWTECPQFMIENNGRRSR